MLRTFIPAVGLLCILLGCEKPEARPSSNPVIPLNDSIVVSDTVVRTYLALGDSYTIGQSVAYNDRFPMQAVSLLNNQNVKFELPEIIAQTGWTTGNLLSRISNNPPASSKYDIVTLLIGVNNQYQRRTQDEYRQEFTTLLEKSIQYANNNKKRVIVLSIPDYSVTPYASGSDKELIAKQIDSFNVINKAVAQQYQVNYIDITGDSRQAAIYPSLIAGDGLHPSGSQYAVWAAKLVPVIKAVLQ